MKKQFETVAVGGTFDELHKGHRVLLLKAFEVGNRVLIGLCTDDFAKKLWKPHKVATYEERLEELKDFLRRKGLLNRAEIMPLNDSYGVTLSSGCVEAIVVSRETEPRAHEINEKRKARGLAPLRVVIIKMIPAENHVSISTTRIRHREIDREGRLLKR
ncbi:MAG: pantetheine-phosphate adenylyltransferase [Candidatus Bathyarchaeota archaeon]|nr:MAG: pantetheine-phosphate adenylyltransferase [Candidatus Bathyarchaeota archaeon]